MKNLQFYSLITLLLSCNSEGSIKTRLKDKVELKTKSKIELKKQQKVLADKSFMEFFETFMWDEEFQKSRIRFPIEADQKIILKHETWKHLSFYSDNDYMPILCSDTFGSFDKDVESINISMSLINFEKTLLNKYYFKKEQNKKWFLIGSENLTFKKMPDFEFIDFLIQFSNDSIFQIQHTKFPFSESYADAENNYEIVNTTIFQKDWEYLRFDVFLNFNMLMVLSNFKEENKFRNIFFRGVENGIWVKYTFEKIQGSWKFIKLEDYST